MILMTLGNSLCSISELDDEKENATAFCLGRDPLSGLIL